jgi:N-methylhydantoinase A
MADAFRAGVDTGGTFTDLVWFEDSELRTLKVFTTREDPGRGILEGLARILPRSSSGSNSLEIIHGTTIATNSLLERRGARVALITTKGFEDLLEIGRQTRPRLYDLNVMREAPLVPAERRFAVNERVAADGKVLRRPARAELRRLKSSILKSGAESVAVCCLFSFANPAHERMVSDELQNTGLPISLSSEILPEFREYERLSTVVVNAYLAPLMSRYLTHLETGLRPHGTSRVASAAVPSALKNAASAEVPLRARSSSRLLLMQSNGGIASAERIKLEPVRTILSGPAGGVAATERLASLLGLRKVISFDMGGTSTDVCLLGGRPRWTREAAVGGLPIAVPTLDIHSVGAGGGSIARMDAGGALRVGPQSACAEPGPACYGRGGSQPTVTDANLILGRLAASHFLGGDYRLDEQSAAECFRRLLHQSRNASADSARFFSTVDQLAAGVVAVANATMERTLRLVSVARGHDPRDFTLVCFGGAGGLHAADLARSLGVQKVIVPQHPGAFSALGVLLSDVIRDASISVLTPVLPSPDGRTSSEFRSLLAALDRRFRELEKAGRAALADEGFDGKLARAERSLDVRYAGQGYELNVPMSVRFPRAFHEEHIKAYGHSQPNERLEIVSLKVRLVIRTPQPRVTAQRSGKSDSRGAMTARQPVWFGGRPVKCGFYDRRLLRCVMRIPGPAVITEYSSTTVIPPDYECRVDRFLNLVLERHAH